jgi:hypothetical protein
MGKDICIAFIIRLRYRVCTSRHSPSSSESEGAIMDERKRPDIRAFVKNMQARMPIGKKVFLAMKNNALKILTRRNCCGHPGEPEC